MLRVKREFGSVFFFRAMQQMGLFLTVLMFAVVPQVSMAAEALVKGEFRPDRLNPQKNQFDLSKSQVSKSGYCAIVDKSFCPSRGILEMEIGGAPLNTYLPIPANSGGLKISGDGRWRSVDIVSAAGEHNTVQVRLAGGSIAFRPGRNAGAPSRDAWRSWLPAGVVAASEAEAYELIFGHDNSRLGSCPNDGGRQNGTGYNIPLFLTLFPAGVARTDCVGQNQYAIEVAYYDKSPHLYIEVLSPSPLSMKAGDYTGYINYRIGAGGDIDFGVGITDPELNIRFEFSVVHDFGVAFPGGSNLLSLVPEGGWMAWLQRGRKPTRLFRDQKFDLAASASFRMSVVCEYPEGASCGIRNDSGHQVPVDIGVTLPNFRDTSNQPVIKYPLASAVSPWFRHAGYYVGKATLHFEVPKADMETMLAHSGSRYSGNVTILFEPEF